MGLVAQPKKMTTTRCVVQRRTGVKAAALFDGNVKIAPMAMGALASFLMLTSSPALALQDQELGSLTGSTAPATAGKQVLEDLPKIDAATSQQVTGAVRQAADDLKAQVVDEAEALVKGEPKQDAIAARGVGAQKPTDEKVTQDKAEGLLANFSQLKSLLQGNPGQPQGLKDFQPATGLNDPAKPRA